MIFFTAFLKVFTSLVSRKCSGALIIAVLGIYIENTEKSHLHFHKKLVSRKKIIFSNFGKYVVLWFGKHFWSKHFLSSTSNIRLLKDKSVTKVFTTAYHIVKSNPEKSQKFELDISLSCKVYNVWTKKVQKSYTAWHYRVMQPFKKNWLVFWKTTWRIWQIFTRALESLKIGTFMESFYKKRKFISLKFTGKLCVVTMKNDEKFEKWLTFQFKTDMRNLTNFYRSIQKHQQFAL